MTSLPVLSSPLREAFQLMRAAQRAEPNPGDALRKERLQRLRKLLLSHRDEISAAIAADFRGRDAIETALIEFFPALAEIRHCQRHLRRWMRPQKVKTAIWFKPGRNLIHYQPLGVVGIVVPWNYPIQLSMAPLANALAAGNRVMLKMSEYSPQFGELMAGLLARYFAADEITVINGDADTAREFVSLPFDHLLFTGSTAVGKSVMRAAAENLTPVTLELGGKSPVIIGDDVHMPRAAQRLWAGKILNAGQTCVAPDYVLLPVGREQAFIDASKRAVQSLLPQGLASAYTAIASERQHQRLQVVLDDARSKGAQIIPLLDGDDSATHLLPRLLLNCTPDMRILQEEIFGPLLPVLAYRALPDAIQWINDHDRPLALYYFGEHQQEIARVLRDVSAGGITINDTLLHAGQETLPFGGIGASGMGAYHGETGFRTFSKAIGVHVASRWQTHPLLYPPFNGLTRWMLKLLLR